MRSDVVYVVVSSGRRCSKEILMVYLRHVSVVNLATLSFRNMALVCVATLIVLYVVGVSGKRRRKEILIVHLMHVWLLLA